MRSSGAGIAALIILCSGNALAVETHNTGDDSDDIVVGCTNRGYGYKAYMRDCNTGDWTVLSTTCTLDEDHHFNLQGGSDTIEFQRGYSEYCYDGSLTWDELDMNGWEVVVHGGTGTIDALYGVDGEIFLYGDGGVDMIYNWASGAGTFLYGAIGGDGNDMLWSYSSSDSDYLSGGANNDCLEDSSGDWTVHDCGSGSDESVNTDDEGGCETLVDTC